MSRVVITGLGTITPAGLTHQHFWQALTEKRCAIGPPSLFDASGFRCQSAAEVKDLMSDSLPGRGSPWKISRSIVLAFAAANAALENAGIDATPGKHPEIGIVCGTTLGGLSPFLQLDRQALADGPRAADPMLFPSAAASAPSCQISIALGMQAFNTTLSNGQTSALDALQYAAQFIRLGRVETVLTGAVEELSLDMFHACANNRLLAGSRAGASEQMRPFDARRSGFVLGEGAAVLVLESLEHALSRRANIWAEFTGYGFSFSPGPRTRLDAAHTAMQTALDRAGLRSSELDAVFSNANGSVAGDRLEGLALDAALPGCPVTSIKPVVGESYSAAGAIQAAAALLALRHQVLPGTCGFEYPDRRCLRLPVVRDSRETKIASAMVNAFGRTGNYASAVFSTYVH
jgi:3-oxoacyl-[acyl-carrier-protein] synthase II